MTVTKGQTPFQCHCQRRNQCRFLAGHRPTRLGGPPHSRKLAVQCAQYQLGTNSLSLILGLPDEIDVTMCSLDAPEFVPPTDHVCAASKLQWSHLTDDLPKHPRGRSPGIRSVLRRRPKKLAGVTSGLQGLPLASRYLAHRARKEEKPAKSRLFNVPPASARHEQNL